MYSDPNPIRSFLIMWEKNIDRSIKKYFEHMHLAMIETMKPNGEPLSIMKEWVECWATGLLSIPTQFTNSACMIEDSYEKIINVLEKTIGYINPAALLAKRMKDKIDEDIDRAGKKILMKLVAKLLDKDDILKLMKAFFLNDNIEQELAIAYSEDNLNSGILLIPDVVERVSAEMHLTQSGKFDPNKYPVIYNAIVMTKLTLLSYNQLNELVASSGINIPTLYGNILYPEYDDYENILFGSIKSIDGNHQWSEYAPQPPYRQGYQRTKDTYDLQFGYGLDSYNVNGFIYYEKAGMRIWQDLNIREKLFRKLFIGPLVPGVDAPEIIGFAPIYSMVNNYNTCTERPFPDGDNDTSCDAISYIDKCINKFSQYFGTKDGSMFVCDEDRDYFCQKTTGGALSQIAIHKSKFDYFGYLYGENWYSQDLSVCN